MKIILTFCLLISISYAQTSTYKNASLSVEERVEDLIQRMTIEEKVSQLVSYWNSDTSRFTAEGEFTGIKDEQIIANGLGAITYYMPNSPQKPASWFAKCNNSIQKYAIEKSRLGIPVFIFGESLHGLVGYGATSYPQSIALGCSWDTELIKEISTATAFESRLRGRSQVLAPVVDLAMDARWGRFEECFGEDPYLVGQFGKASVLGYQGNGETIDKEHVIATLKHFVGHGQSESGKNLAPVNIPERLMR